MKKRPSKSTRRRFLSAFTSHLADGVTDIAKEIGANSSRTFVYADKKSFAARNRALWDHACQEGLKRLDRVTCLRRRGGLHEGEPVHCVAQGSLETALACLEANREAGLAGWIARAVIKLQVTDPNDPNYGDFPWVSRPEGVSNPAAVCFIARNLAALHQRVERLSPEVVEDIHQALNRCATALNRYRPPWARTHLRLLNICGLALCAEHSADEDVEDYARERWDEWFQQTSRNGIAEYNSPSDSAIACFALEALWESLPKGRWRSEVELALDYLIFEMLAHTHAHTWTLSGTMCRSDGAHLHGDGWTTLYLHRQFGTRAPATWTVWAANFLVGTYRAPRWLHDFCWKRPSAYEVVSDHPHQTRHSPWPLRRRLRVDSTVAVGSQSGTFFPPQEVPFLLTYYGSRSREAGKPRETIAGCWRTTAAAGPETWSDWRLSVASDQTMLDTLTLLSFEPVVQEPRRIEFVFSLGQSDDVSVSDDYNEYGRDQLVPWPRGFRIHTGGPVLGLWIYEPVDVRSGERQTYSLDVDMGLQLGGEHLIVLSTRCVRPLAVPILIAARRDRRRLPLDPPVANTDRNGNGIVARVSVPQTGTLSATIPPPESPEVILHRSRFLTLRPGALEDLADKGARFRTLYQAPG